MGNRMQGDYIRQETHMRGYCYNREERKWEAKPVRGEITAEAEL